MHGDDRQITRRSSSSRNGHSQFTLNRNESFINNMNIISPGFFAPDTRENVFVPEPTHHHHREEHLGNVFTGFRSEEIRKPPEPKINLAQTYQRQCLEYEKYLFDSRIKMIIKRMAIKAYNIFKNEKEGQFFVFPIQKLIVTIAKKLLLNRFQLLFLQYVFQETKWRYDIDCIRKQVTKYKSYMMIPDSEGSSIDLKLMQVYILNCAYFSKKSLNQLSTDNMFTTFCNQICPSFKQFYNQWTQNSEMGSRIKPKQLNTIFKRLTSNFERDHQDVQNYCLIVQEIIDISPAYNADKTGKQKKIRKNKKKQSANREEDEEEEQPRHTQMRQQSNNRYNEIVHQEESIDMIDPPMFKQKKSSVLSVDLLEAGHYLTRSVSQQDRR